MRTLHSLPAVLISLMLTTGVQAQEATGLPGDNFSLEGALEMFKKAENPGAFEKMLNTKENGVNNLDLNNDGDIDYIRVINKKDGDVQLFVLQSLVSSSESQDVAVIQLEKTDNEQAVIQIVGDEDIYGVAKIVEPSEDDVTAFNDATLQDRPHGPNAAFAPSGIVVNVWFWPSVRFVFAPHYTIWASPWRWYHYPTWWRPWRPLAWDVYAPICYHYRPRYWVVHTHRISRAPYIYRPMRMTSVSVYNRNRVVVNNYRTNYRSSPSRQYDRGSNVNRSTPSRQFDRGSNANRSTPSRQYDRNPNVNRSTPSRQYDRGDIVDRNTPSRQYDRTPNVDRSTPSRQYDRTPDVDRNTPSRQYDRTPNVDRNIPSRQYDRTPNVDRNTPSRQLDRTPNVDRSTPSRQYDRSPNVNRSTPSRQYDRGTPSARPQGGQMNRSPRSGNTPQRSNRPSRERS